MRAVVGVLGLVIALGACGKGDGSIGVGSDAFLVGRLHELNSTSLVVQAQCVGEDEVDAQSIRLTVSSTAVVSMPFGDHESGGGHVEVVTVEELAEALARYEEWTWDITVEDDEVIEIGPRFLAGCETA